MTEVERADEIASGPRRRLKQNIAMVVAITFGLAGVIFGWHELEQRAEMAETSAISLAEQVQQACESQGSLDLDGRDLCKQADDVVEDPALARTPTDGRNGVDGTDGVDGRDGIDGQDGRDGKPGKDGKTGPPGEPGAEGPPGAPGSVGEPGTPGTPGEPGTDGKDGADGAPGTDGRGISDIVCHTTGDWIITLTDGTALTVDGPCRVTQPEPTPTATTTKGR